jgi:futalosine hydrolase
VSGLGETLVLVPTELERAQLERHFEGHTLECVGFGPIAAAARAAALIAATRARRVLLIGIAGSYDRSAQPIGTAHLFTSVVLDGLGVHTSTGFKGPRELGFAQVPARGTHAAVFDVLALAAPQGTRPALLLTAPTASGDATECAARLERRPHALAEDMEAFGVALAAREFDVPCAVVRGISNAVGDRRFATWRVADALASAAELARATLAAPWLTAQDGRP